MQVYKKTTTVINCTDERGDAHVIELNDAQVDVLRHALLTPSTDWRVLALLGKKIEAIKQIRKLTGVGLNEARQVADMYAEVNELDTARDWLKLVHYERDTNLPAKAELGEHLVTRMPAEDYNNYHFNPDDEEDDL